MDKHTRQIMADLLQQIAAACAKAAAAIENGPDLRQIRALGGKAAAAAMSPQQRRERARKAAGARWGKADDGS